MLEQQKVKLLDIEPPTDWVRLRVGGELFQTALLTLVINIRNLRAISDQLAELSRKSKETQEKYLPTQKLVEELFKTQQEQKVEKQKIKSELENIRQTIQSRSQRAVVFGKNMMAVRQMHQKEKDRIQRDMKRCEMGFYQQITMIHAEIKGLKEEAGAQNLEKEVEELRVLVEALKNQQGRG